MGNGLGASFKGGEPSCAFLICSWGCHFFYGFTELSITWTQPSCCPKAVLQLMYLIKMVVFWFVPDFTLCWPTASSVTVVSCFALVRFSCCTVMCLATFPVRFGCRWLHPSTRTSSSVHIVLLCFFSSCPALSCCSEIARGGSVPAARWKGWSSLSQGRVTLQLCLSGLEKEGFCRWNHSLPWFVPPVSPQGHSSFL